MKRFLAILILIYIPIIYFGIQTQYYSDEDFYFQMGKAVLNGHSPYSDFFCAHMPLMIYPISFLFLIFEPSITAGKFLPLMSSFFVLILVYFTGERYKEKVGALACFLLLISPKFHLYSHNFYGVFLCSALIMLSFYFHLKGNAFLSGTFAILSIFVRLNALPWFILLLLLNLRKRDFYYGILTMSPLFIFLLVPNFIDNTIFYHLAKTPIPLENKLSEVYVFISSEWFIILLSVLGILAIFLDLKEKSLDINKLLLLFPFVFILITILQTSVFDYYFIIILPFLAILGSCGVVRFSGIHRKFIPLIFLVVIIGIFLNYNAIINTYLPEPGFNFEELANFVQENSGSDGKILFIGVGNAYIGMKTNRDIPENFIDISGQRFEVYRENIDLQLLDSIEEKPELVITELKHLHYIRHTGTQLGKSMDYLENEYYPVDYFHEEISNLLFMVWKPIEETGKGGDFLGPEKNITCYYFDRYLLKKDTTLQYGEAVHNESKDYASRLYPSRYLISENVMNQKLIADGIFDWQFEDKQYCSKTGDGLESRIWAGSDKNVEGNFIIYSHKDLDPVSFTYVVFNQNRSCIERLDCFARLSNIYGGGFILTYSKKGISLDDYNKIRTLLREFSSGSISREDYVKYSRVIIQENIENKIVINR